MNHKEYKEECKEYFDNSNTNISRLEHRAKEAHKRHISLCEEMDKNGEEWFYFEYVEKKNSDANSTMSANGTIYKMSS